MLSTRSGNPAQQGGARAQRGGSLLEALFAITLFSFGLLGLVGALASAMRAADEARLRSEAALLAQALIAEMWTTAATELDARFAAGGSALSDWKRRAAKRLPGATTAVELTEADAAAPGRSVVVALTWLRPGSAERHRFVTAACIGRNS